MTLTRQHFAPVDGGYQLKPHERTAEDHAIEARLHPSLWSVDTHTLRATRRLVYAWQRDRTSRDVVRDQVAFDESLEGM